MAKHRSLQTFTIAQSTGFHLIEVMLVLTLIGVIGTLSTPSLSRFINHNALTSQVNLINSNLQVAKIIAANKFVYVTVCPTTDNQNCAEQWQHSVMTFIDLNNNKKRDNAEEMINLYEIPKRMRLEVNRTLLRFAPFNSAATTAATVKFCIEGVNNKALVISNMGRIRLEQNPAKVKCKVSDK